MENSRSGINPFERRSALRRIVDDYYTIEFSLAGKKSVHRFKIRDINKLGMAILVERDCEVLNVIKVNDVIEIRYYPTEKKRPVHPAKVRIVHITFDNLGRFDGMAIVGIDLIDED